MTGARAALALIGALAACVPHGLPAAAAEESVVTLAVRPGASVRLLVARAAAERGTIVLLPGGNGVLDIDAGGRIGSDLAGNQLVRSRELFVRAGFATVLPDVASDLKGTRLYLPSPEHASGIGAAIAHAATLARPVWLVGTSRAAIAVAAAMTKQSAALPAGVVITSGMLMSRGDLSAESVGGLERIRVPVLLLAHRDDSCRYTPPGDAPLFKALLTGAPRVDITVLTGGAPRNARAEPCGGGHYHGFFGIDDAVVATIVAWIGAQGGAR